MDPLRTNHVTPLFLSFCFLILINNSFYGQLPDRELFNIIFENNFDDNSTGNYLLSDFAKDWNVFDGSGPVGKLEIITDDTKHKKAMRAFYPAGTISPSNEHGFTWYSRLPDNQSDIYFSYDVRFKPGFQWVLGGKLPGIVGGSVTSGQLPTNSSGFSVRPCWKRDGSLIFYVYHPGQSGIYGDSYSFEGFRFETGRWYNLTMRLVINTVSSGDIKDNGILEGFIDGKLVFQSSNFRYRLNEKITIDRMYICSFFGGDTQEWAPLKDEWIDTDNYIIYNYSDKIKYVPRGTPSSPYQQLIHPYLNINDTEWKTTLKSSDNSQSSVTLTWGHYPVPVQYILERGTDGTFTTIASLPYGTNSFVDKDLSPSVIYTYRLKAGNSIQEIKASPNLQAPVSPSGLRSLKFEENAVTLAWKDNSNNEESFVITRSAISDPTQVVEITVNANDTVFTDSNLLNGTSYIYSVRAVNLKGNSTCSNKIFAATPSDAELKRVRNGIIAYYNFSYNPDLIIYDQSAYREPVDLKVQDSSAIDWDAGHSLDIHSSTALVSTIAAKKIVNAIKETNQLTFECWVKPKEPETFNHSRIVSLAASDQDVGFLLDQELIGGPENKSLAYSVRLQTESTIPSGYPEFHPEYTQPYLSLQHIVYIRDSAGYESLYLNGSKVSDSFRPSNLSTWKDNYYLRLGNESDMGHFWKGSFYTVAFYKKALTPEEILKNYSAGPCDKIKQEDIDFLVELYPNPVNEKAYLKITPTNISDTNPEIGISITNIFGKCLYSNILFNPYIQNIVTLDFCSFQNGVYFVQITSGDEQKTEKVIVIK